MTKNQTRSIAFIACFTVAGMSPSAAAVVEDDPPPASTSLVDAVLETPSPEAMRRWHDLLGQDPHSAGTPGDRVVIEALAGAFDGMGLETETWWFEPLLSRPVAASLRIVGEASPDGDQSLRIKEDEFPEDPSTSHPDLTWGWNAYSGSGIVEAGVVYANRGTREDFARLRELGIDCTDRIVLARYGGNYRGYKAKFAEEAGAAGLVVFTDPGDSGDDRGPVWPDGGWANSTYVQRGSMVTLPYKGDPLTPGRPALDGVPRLPLEEVALPGIPIQPIGYAAATRIMAAMEGPTVAEVAGDGSLDSWTGGLDVPYRIEGGDLELRLEVEQVRERVPTANVFGVLPGAEVPEEIVVIGCHHDAWTFGAGDPLAGMIVLLETARGFAEAADRGFRPRRTLVFAAWGAEEFGVIGSSEWVEANRAMLQEHAVAYVNLDMAAMGTNFGASATPSLAEAVVAAAAEVRQPGDASVSVAEAWAGDRGPAACGDLGGGSDHVGFVCHVGVPCVSLRARGGAGSSYHSSYDTLAWYRSVVGEDYEGAMLVANITSRLVAALADDPVPPVRPSATVASARSRLEAYERAADEAGLDVDFAPLRVDLEALATVLRTAEARVDASASGEDVSRVAASARRLRNLERLWLDPPGLPGRPWYENTFATSDRDSGYGAVVLPLLAEAIRDGDEIALAEGVRRYRAIVGRMMQPPAGGEE